MPAKSLDSIRRYAQLLVDDNAKRNKAFLRYQQMYHGEYNLPKALTEVDWIYKSVSSDPHDSINTAVKVLASLDPRVNFMPMLPTQANIERSTMIERVLKWQLKSANRRRPSSIVADMAQSSLLYAALAVQVIDLEWQIKQAQEEIDTKRWQMAKKYGRFVVNTYNPYDVYCNYSDFMPEAVFLRKERKASSVMGEWGNRALDLLDAAEKNQTVMYCDYMDYEDRAIWCEGTAGGAQVTILPPMKHDLPFLPWIAMMGGSTLENDPQHQYHPLLYSVLMTGQWEMQNVVDTLIVSDAIAHAASPRYVVKTLQRGSAHVDAFDPSRPLEIDPTEEAASLAPPMIDRALVEIGDRVQARIQTSTVPRILQGGNIPSGTSYSALNLATQNAANQLKPYKSLTERGLSEVFVSMLLWTKFTDIPLVGYEQSDKEIMGKEYTILPDEIADENLYIEVDLVNDVPTDRIQRANTAIQLVTAGLYSKLRGMEDLGVDDPDKEMERITYERFYDQDVQLLIQQEQDQYQLQLQQQQMQMQMQMQGQMQQDQMQQQQQGQMANMQQQQMAQQQAQQQQMQMGQGQLFNTAQGGLPQVLLGPQGNREQATNMDMFGNPTSEGGLMP